MLPRPHRSTLFPYTTLFRSHAARHRARVDAARGVGALDAPPERGGRPAAEPRDDLLFQEAHRAPPRPARRPLVRDDEQREIGRASCRERAWNDVAVGAFTSRSGVSFGCTTDSREVRAA